MALGSGGPDRFPPRPRSGRLRRLDGLAGDRRQANATLRTGDAGDGRWRRSGPGHGRGVRPRRSRGGGDRRQPRRGPRGGPGHRGARRARAGDADGRHLRGAGGARRDRRGPGTGPPRRRREQRRRPAHRSHHRVRARGLAPGPRHPPRRRLPPHPGHHAALAVLGKGRAAPLHGEHPQPGGLAAQGGLRRRQARPSGPGPGRREGGGEDLGCARTSSVQASSALRWWRSRSPSRRGPSASARRRW